MKKILLILIIPFISIFGQYQSEIASGTLADSAFNLALDQPDSNTIYRNAINALRDSLLNIYTEGQVDAFLSTKLNVSDTTNFRTFSDLKYFDSTAAVQDLLDRVSDYLPDSLFFSLSGDTTLNDKKTLGFVDPYDTSNYAVWFPLKIRSNNPAGNWLFTGKHNPNSATEPLANTVYMWGINVAGNGARLNTDYPAIFETMESGWETGGNVLVERHTTFIDENGNDYRVISWTGNKATGYIDYGIAADILSLQTANKDTNYLQITGQGVSRNAWWNAHLLPVPDSLFDIGLLNTGRWRDLFLARDADIGGNIVVRATGDDDYNFIHGRLNIGNGTTPEATLVVRTGTDNGLADDQLRIVSTYDETKYLRMQQWGGNSIIDAAGSGNFLVIRTATADRVTFNSNGILMNVMPTDSTTVTTGQLYFDGTTGAVKRKF